MRVPIRILLIFAAGLLLGCHSPCEDDSDCLGSFVCIGSSVCPDDVECVWEGEPGICGFPAEKACEISGGTWDPNSCGDYQCGQFPACDAVIPGCDCGPHENFVEGLGCRPDPGCRGECRWDSDCPHGFTCEGSSVCPPDVVCVWEGEPGVCEATERFLCHASEGRWDETACGHRRCESDITCLAIIPGCDCGPQANFDPALGCVDVPECAGR